jgi:hypothetical protein
MATGTFHVRAEALESLEQSLIESLPLEEQIRRRAHEIWLENGSPAGTDLIDWLEAEREIVSEEKR